MLRIFPLYYAVLLLWIVIGPAFGAERVIAELWMHGAGPNEGVWYWLCLSDWSDGLAGRFSRQFLAVAWSLAIEEQFYLV